MWCLGNYFKEIIERKNKGRKIFIVALFIIGENFKWSVRLLMGVSLSILEKRVKRVVLKVM